MVDPNLEKLADILLDYSFEMVDFRRAWKKDRKRLWLRYKPSADELAQIITEKIFDRGGNVFLEQTPSWRDYTFYTKASEDVLTGSPEFRLYKLHHSAARLVILSDSNTKSLANVDPKRRTKWSKAAKPYSHASMEVDTQGNFLTPWCGVIFPTEAYAQDIGMSLPECREYIYRAMYLDAKDPVKEWRRVARSQRKMIKEILSKARLMTIVDEADDTELEMSVEGHRWIVSVKGIKLKFKEGKIIQWEADVGRDYLDEFLSKNPGADYLGEIAFGRHPRIDRISKQILLDEKMGGTVHFALGRAYGLHVLGNKDRSSLNQSIRHWDLIRDMRRPTAYVRIDDKSRLIWDKKACQWKTEPL